MRETPSDYSLLGKVALVTGAGRGIGRAIAIGYAAAGAAVCCTARTQSEIEEVATHILQRGGKAIAVACNVAEFASVTAAVQRTVDELGQLDIVVINAGVNLALASIETSDPGQWAETVQINLIGAYHCMKAALPYLRLRGGHIITIGSGRGHRADPGRTAYSSSKAGLAMLTRAAAEEVWRDGICVNELIPGPVMTAMMKQSAAQKTEGLDLQYDREWLKPPEAVVPLAVWIAATDPRTGPTGQRFSLMRRDAL